MLVLSVATMLLVFVGPWVLMMIMRGTFEANLAEPWFLPAVAISVGPGLALQIYWALHVSLRRGSR